MLHWRKVNGFFTIAPVISNIPSTEDLSANEDQSKETPKDDNDENESEHQVDLDTRLKMLMKNKSGGAMPSFLLNELNGSEEDDSDKEIKDLMLKNNEDSRSSLPNSSILLPQHQAGKNFFFRFFDRFLLMDWLFFCFIGKSMKFLK